jgi:type IV pilus assembly protein PilY1
MIAVILLASSLIAGAAGSADSARGSPAAEVDCGGVSATPSSVRVEYDSRVAAVGRMSALIFAPSSSGELAAIDADSGTTLWTFVAPEVLASTAPQGLMTDLAVLRFDANGDGVIDAAGGDRVWVYFGLKRAGAYYYALDVSRRTPRVLWTAGADTLEGLADAWSTPTVARVRVSGAAQNGEHFVIVVGGGFSRDSSAAGNHVFMLDAATGHALWSAGSSSAGSADSSGGLPRVSSNLSLARMTYGVAARIATLDIDGDGFADRLYTADVGGQVWRFDVWNGRARNELVTGGVLASLGASESASGPAGPASAPGVAPSPTPTPPAGPPPGPGAALVDARRFFTAPDVALLQPRGESAWYNLAIGSGDGDDVRAMDVRNRFYSLRDRAPFTKHSQADYDATSPILDADLTPVTTSAAGIPTDSPGWKLDLAANEQVLAEPVTTNGVVMFTTHEPGASIEGSLCASGGDTNRVYALRVESAAAALDLNDDARVTDADRSAVLEQKGVAPGVRIETPGPEPRAGTTPGGPGSPAGPGGPGAAGTPASGAPSQMPRCLVGAEVLNRCVPLDAVLRTFWKRTSVN